MSLIIFCSSGMALLVSRSPAELGVVLVIFAVVLCWWFVGFLVWLVGLVDVGIYDLDVVFDLLIHIL